MFDSPNVLALLPEYILTLVGVAVMMLEPLLPIGRSRKPLGWLAIAGAALACAASFYQVSLIRAVGGPIFAFANTVQVDRFSVFFEILITAITMGLA